MTTRYRPDNLRSLWSTMHEAGHGLTFRGVDPALRRSPLDGNASLGLGESQSRTWENLVGRSLAVLARPLPAAAAGVPAARGGRPRHLVPRHQPRRAGPDPRRGGRGHLLAPHHPPLRARAGARRRHARSGRPARGVERADARAARRRGARTTCAASSRTCTGRAPSYGYFPTYALGNVLSRPDLARGRGGSAGSRRAARGGRVRAALRGAARRGCTGTGRKFMPMETLERAIGANEIDPQPYLAYLRGKVAGLQPA